MRLQDSVLQRVWASGCQRLENPHGDSVGGKHFVHLIICPDIEAQRAHERATPNTIGILLSTDSKTFKEIFFEN